MPEARYNATWVNGVFEPYIEVRTEHYTETVGTERSYPFSGQRSSKKVAKMVRKTGQRLLKKEARRAATFQSLKKEGVF